MYLKENIRDASSVLARFTAFVSFWLTVLYILTPSSSMGSMYVPLESQSEDENQLISYDVITGEETIYDFPHTEDDMPINDWFMEDGIIEQEKICEGKMIERQSKLLEFTELELIENPQDYPWSANVKLLIFATDINNNGICDPEDVCYQGSGTLIDPMHVITAGHCVYDPRKYPGGWALKIKVIPGYKNNVELPYGIANSVILYAWSKWTDQDWSMQQPKCGDPEEVWNEWKFTNSHDIGLIYLDRPIGTLSGWHEYDWNENSDFYLFNIFNNAGYPADQDEGYDGEELYYWYGNFDLYQYRNVNGVIDWHINVENTSFGGQSGSGAYAFFAPSGSRVVYAVLSSQWYKCDDLPPTPYTLFAPITFGKFLAFSETINNNTPTTIDLIPLDVTVSPSNVCSGEQLSSISYLVHNYSSDSWSGTVNVDVYLSTDDDISPADTFIQSHSFDWNFSPKSSVRVNISSPPTIPTDTAEGDYYLGVVLNFTDYNTGNNDTDRQDASHLYVIPSPSTPNSIIYPVSDCDSDFTVSWSTVSEATSYTLQRATDASFTDAITVYDGPLTSYGETELADGEYYYRVGADSDNCSSEWRDGDAIEVIFGLTADFTGSSTTGCAPLVVNFTDQSSGSPTSWSWDFGDDGTSTQQNPSHTYTNPGIYTVRLTLSNDCGSDTLTKVEYITAGQDPVADFTGSPTSGCAPLTVNFTDQSTDNPTIWSWDFGDGGWSNQQNPFHVYVSPGVYNLTLSASNDCGSDNESKMEYIIVDTCVQNPDIIVTDSLDPDDDLHMPFGDIYVTTGNLLEATVTITSDGNGVLIIYDIASANILEPPFSIEIDNCSNETLEPGENCTLTVRFEPTTTGEFSDSFDIPSSDPDEDPVTITVSGSGEKLTITTTTAVNSSTTTTTAGLTTSTSTPAPAPPCPTELIYGEYSEEAEFLRHFRDNVLSKTPEGQEIIRLYYKWNPIIAEIMEEDEEFKGEMRKMIDGVLQLITEKVE